MRIDHVDPRSSHKEKIFDYHNLVGSCFGNEKALPPRDIHCDPRKDRLSLHADLKPTNPNCENQLLVTSEGQVVSKSLEVSASVEEVLNLNHKSLKISRKKALVGFLDVGSTDEALALIAGFEEKKDEKFEPFCGIIITYLRQEYL